MPQAPSALVKLVLEGSLGQGEVFATGFWVPSIPDVGVAGLQADVDSLRTFMQTGASGPLATLATLIDSGARYNGIRAYAYNAGDTAARAQVFSAFTSLFGGSGTGSLPLQSAIVATLRTGRIGRQYRGRMYLPCTAQPLTAHQLGSTTITALLGALKATFNNAATYSSMGSPRVVSFTGGHTAAVTQITMDSKIDIQRRRAAKEAITTSGNVSIP